MLRVAGQTAEFFVDTHGWPGGVIGKKIDFFHGQRRALHLVIDMVVITNGN